MRTMNKDKEEMINVVKVCIKFLACLFNASILMVRLINICECTFYKLHLRLS